MAARITLLTDFGCQDGYVGVMKGVVAGICTTACITDLTHHIPPQNITSARFALLNAYPYFPAGTIHTVVVDPGVGTHRRAVAVQTPTGYLVGPDNGVLSGVIDQMGTLQAVSLTNANYWLTTAPSATFHGRDIFAPVAAHLAAGVPLSDLGTEISPESLIRLEIPQPRVTETSVVGHIQHIDHFGNLITTIPKSIAQQKPWQVQIGQIAIPFRSTYGEVDIGHALALVGSHGWVEIAINSSSARARFRVAVGDQVQLCTHYGD